LHRAPHHQAFVLASNTVLGVDTGVKNGSAKNGAPGGAREEELLKRIAVLEAQLK